MRRLRIPPHLDPKPDQRFLDWIATPAGAAKFNKLREDAWWQMQSERARTDSEAEAGYVWRQLPGAN